MLTTKKHDDDLPRSTNEEPIISKGGGEMIPYYLTSSNKRQKICKGGVAIKSLPSGTSFGGGLGRNGSTQDVSELLSEEAVSKMSGSAVSLLLFDEGVNVLTCSGVPVERRLSHLRVLTSAKLAITLEDKRKAGSSMTIQVHDVSNNIARGWLQHYDLDLGIAFVKVTDFLDVCVVHLRHGMEFLPHGNLVAIQLDSGALTPLVLSKDLSASEVGKALCKSSKAGDGAPLFDDDGNFVGMLLLDTGRWSYVQMSVIIEQLEQFEKKSKLRVSRRLNQFRPEAIHTREERRRNGKHYSCNPKAIELTAQDLFEDVDSLGYPKQPETEMEGDIVLVNTFEEMFGDSFDSGEGVWSKLNKTVAENLSQSVVSLASYNGKTRFFVCSGVIIKWKGCSAILTSASLVRSRFDEKKIDENLEIDVLLPNKQHTEGTLEHYNLHYNVAIVSFKGYGDHSTANIHDRGSLCSSVVAVGRCFKSSMLMATRGTHTGWQSRFDCDAVQYSTCEITKAGIGGPLVDFEGKFVGMNFYDWKEGTPFLPQAMIALVLAHFEKKRIVDVVDKYGYTNRWPVPKPLWRRPNEHHPENEEKEEFTVHVPGSSIVRRYGHLFGNLVCLI